MPVTYNLKSLPTFDAAAHLRVEAAVSPEQAFAYAPFTFPGRHRGRHVPAPPRGLPDRLSLGTLSWPVGAARFAHGHFLCDDATLGRLRPYVYTPGSGNYAPKVLTLSDGSSDGLVSTSLYLLPPLPLFQTSASLWLLTFVDERFFWWEKSLDLIITDGTTTWANVFGAISTALGATITPDAIPAAYGKPPGNLAGHYDHLPLLLDAVCAAVGHRLVRNLAGTVVTQAPRTAKARQDANLLAQEPTRRGGGKLNFDKNDRANDMNGLAPASVRVLFPRQSTATPPAAFTYPVSVTLAGLTLPEYQGVAGRPASVTAPTDLHHPAVYTGGNAAALATLATQAATDYYLWLLGRAEVRYDGIRPWLPSGMDAVEWSHHAGAVLTTARRPPWDAGPPAAPPGVNVSDGTTTYPGVTTITVNPPLTIINIVGPTGPTIKIVNNPPGPPAIGSMRTECYVSCEDGTLVQDCYLIYVAPNGSQWVVDVVSTNEGCCDCPSPTSPPSGADSGPCTGKVICNAPLYGGSYNNVGTLTFTEPAGAKVGDLGFFTFAQDTDAAWLLSPDPPTGWTLAPNGAVTKNDLQQKTYTKVLAGGEVITVNNCLTVGSCRGVMGAVKNAAAASDGKNGGMDYPADRAVLPSMSGTGTINIVVGFWTFRDGWRKAGTPQAHNNMVKAPALDHTLDYLHPPNADASLTGYDAWEGFAAGPTPAFELDTDEWCDGDVCTGIICPITCPPPGGGGGGGGVIPGCLDPGTSPTLTVTVTDGGGTCSGTITATWISNQPCATNTGAYTLDPHPAAGGACALVLCCDPGTGLWLLVEVQGRGNSWAPTGGTLSPFSLTFTGVTLSSGGCPCGGLTLVFTP